MYGYTMYHRPHRMKLNGFFMFGADWTASFDFNWADKFRGKRDKHGRAETVAEEA